MAVLSKKQYEELSFLNHCYHYIFNYDCKPECHCIRHSTGQAQISFCPEMLGLLNS